MPHGKHHLPTIPRGLSARLLVLTLFFVMLAEVLIYAPSIGRYRKVYLEDRLGAAHLAILALEAGPEAGIARSLEDELLAHVGAYAIEFKRPGVPKELMLGQAPPITMDATFDLRKGTFFGFIAEAFVTLAQSDGRTIRVYGPSPSDPAVVIDIVLDEQPMRMAMIDYSERILMLSLAISALTAALVYLSLQWLMVYPMRRITENMTRFRDDPEDPSKVIVPVRRSDEIGVAERALADMEIGLRSALRQRGRLAALGAAVTRINHDLRNILATARLVSDRLATLQDPQVQRIVPTLVGAIDRAVTLCAQTLDFARAEQPPERSRFALAEFVDDVGEALRPSVDAGFDWDNAVTPAIEIDADRNQMFRVLTNLGTNAIKCGARRMSIRAEDSADAIVIMVSDDGPGIDIEAKDKLFEPFAGSGRQGGTGLGLAIVRELIQGHGGEVELKDTGPGGTSFRIWLPRSPAGRRVLFGAKRGGGRQG